MTLVYTGLFGALSSTVLCLNIFSIMLNKNLLHAANRPREPPVRSCPPRCLPRLEVGYRPHSSPHPGLAVRSLESPESSEVGVGLGGCLGTWARAGVPGRAEEAWPSVASPALGRSSQVQSWCLPPAGVMAPVGCCFLFSSLPTSPSQN